MVRFPSSDSTLTVCGSTNVARPWIISDVVARQRVADDLDLALDDPHHVPHELLHRGPAMRAELVRGFEAGPEWRGGRFAKGLRGDRPGLDANAPDAPLLFDHGDPLPSLEAWMAARCPAGPLPMQIKSTSNRLSASS